MSDASSFPCRLVLFAGALGTALSCAPEQSVNRAVSVSVRRDDAGAREAAAIDPIGGAQATPDAAGSAPPAPDAAPAPPIDQPSPQPQPPSPQSPPAATPPPGAAPDARPGTDGFAPPAELIEIEHSNPGTTVTDLSMAGTLDWMHFGFQGTDAVNRKRSNRPPLILMTTLGTGLSGRSSADFSRFIWGDGTPVAGARNVQSGFETSTASAGFQITVLGDPEQPRVVKLHVGSQEGRARLTARFGSFGAPVHIDRSLDAVQTERNRVYTIVFQPSNIERPLIVEWTVDGTGNARLQAVTLSEAPMIAAP